jgi:soluble lytic murein transglycosylase
MDLLRKYEGGPALKQLEELRKTISCPRSPDLLKQGSAHELSNDSEKAREIWQKLLETYPQSPVVAEAYYSLGKYNPHSHEKLLKEYPRHPQTLALIRQRLQENPESISPMVTVSQG